MCIRCENVRCSAGLADVKDGRHRLTLRAGTWAQNGLHALQIFGQAFRFVPGWAAWGVLRRHVEDQWVSDEFKVAQECNGEYSGADRNWKLQTITSFPIPRSRQSKDQMMFVPVPNQGVGRPSGEGLINREHPGGCDVSKWAKVSDSRSI